MRLNFDHELSSRLRVGSSTSLIRTEQNVGRGDAVYTEALTNNPLGMAFDSTGAILFKPTPDGQPPLARDQHVARVVFVKDVVDHGGVPADHPLRPRQHLGGAACPRLG